MNVVECNPLYFPKGNEYGETWQPYYKATHNSVYEYGRSPEDAIKNLQEKLNENNNPR